VSQPNTTSGGTAAVFRLSLGDYKSHIEKCQELIHLVFGLNLTNHMKLSSRDAVAIGSSHKGSLPDRPHVERTLTCES